eukprot:4130459-Amphidinium_carterae.1
MVAERKATPYPTKCTWHFVSNAQRMLPPKAKVTPQTTGDPLLGSGSEECESKHDAALPCKLCGA